jgi:hypothetical protein
MLRFRQHISKMPISIRNAEASVATDDDSSNAAGLLKNKLMNEILPQDILLVAD